MIAERQQRYPKSTYRISVTGAIGNTAQYVICNLSSNHCSQFPSLWNLLQWIEQDIDQIGFPQNTFKYRTWGTGAAVARKNEGNIDIAPATAGSPTFIIQVLYRQNATWQGTIQWVEGRQTLTFRSEYELLRLMDEAMQATVAKLDGDYHSWET